MTFAVFVFSFFVAFFVLILVQPEFRSDLISLFYVVLGVAVLNAALTKMCITWNLRSAALLFPLAMLGVDTWIFARFAYVSPARALIAAVILVGIFLGIVGSVILASLLEAGAP